MHSSAIPLSVVRGVHRTDVYVLLGVSFLLGANARERGVSSRRRTCPDGKLRGLLVRAG